MKTRFFIIIGVVAILTGIFLILEFSQDSRNTENPNECWFQDDDGKMKPCVIETGESGLPFSPLTGQNCDELCQESKNETENHSVESQITLVSVNVI